jgi:hypothetical protein
MNKKMLAGAGLVVIVAIAIAYFTVTSLSGPHTKLSQKVEIPSKNAASAIAYGTHEILLTGPDSFTTYDYTTGQSKVPGGVDLGKNGLANADTVSVSPDKTYILFHDVLVTDGGLLAQQLAAQGQDPAADYWWVYNTKDNSFHNLPPDTMIAKLSGDTVYALEYSPGATLNSYNPDTMERKNSLSVLSSVNDFYVVDKGFLLQTYTDKVYYTSDNIVNDQLFDTGALVGVTADKKTAFVVKTENKIRSLVRVDVANNNAESTVASTVYDTPILSQSLGLVLYNTTAKGDYTLYTISSKETRKLAFGAGALPNIATDKDTSPVTPSAILSNDAIIASDNNGKYYVIGNNLHGAK